MAATALKRGKHVQQRDRISEMPDEILGQIMLLMPIEDAVKTSSLSKRWKTVWTSIHTVVIRESDWFTYSRYPNMYLKTKEARFVIFLESVFNHLVSLQKLVLNCRLYVSQGIDIVTNKLYGHAASLNELDLTLRGPTMTDSFVELPPSIFTSRNLVILKLNFKVEGLLKLPSLVVWLPCLKVLCLKISMDVSFVANILAGCPVLEELSLVGSMRNELNSERRLCVMSSSLKRLNLHFTCSISINIEMSLSHLEELDLSFDLRGPIGIVSTSTSLPLLTRVKLHIFTLLDENPEKLAYGDRLIELLTKAPNIKYLTLSSYVVICLHYARFYRQLLMFEHLTNLSLNLRSISWPLLHWFLESSPNLVSLSIYNGVHFHSQSQHTPNCLMMMMPLHQLEKVELKLFQGSDHQMNLVRYLLKKAPVLKEMTVSYEDDKAKATRLHIRVAKLPKKASAAWKVVDNFYYSQANSRYVSRFLFFFFSLVPLLVYCSGVPLHCKILADVVQLLVETEGFESIVISKYLARTSLLALLSASLNSLIQYCVHLGSTDSSKMSHTRARYVLGAGALGAAICFL